MVGIAICYLHAGAQLDRDHKYTIRHIAYAHCAPYHGSITARSYHQPSGRRTAEHYRKSYLSYRHHYSILIEPGKGGNYHQKLIVAANINYLLLRHAAALFQTDTV